MSFTKLSLGGNNLIINRLGTGSSRTFFFSVIYFHFQTVRKNACSMGTNVFLRIFSLEHDGEGVTLRL
jgi:hypothetical protein